MNHNDIKKGKENNKSKRNKSKNGQRNQPKWMVYCFNAAPNDNPRKLNGDATMISMKIRLVQCFPKQKNQTNFQLRAVQRKTPIAQP